jgi:hypothetical protein
MSREKSMSDANKPDCPHMNFQGDLDVFRLSDTEDGPITGFTASVRIKCVECGLAFRFPGIAAGSHFAEPRVSIDGEELRLPIEPATHAKFAAVAGYVMQPKEKH